MLNVSFLSADSNNPPQLAAGEARCSADNHVNAGMSRRQLVQTAAIVGTAAVAGVARVPRSAAATANLLSVADWERKFLGIWAKDDATYLPMSVSGNSRAYYDLAYSIDGNAAMFQATGKTTYLDRALLYIENTIGSAKLSSTFPRSRFKDGYSGWVSQESGTYNGQEVVLYEIYLWRYVTRVLRLMQANTTVWADPAYQARFQRILAFTETNIFDKWYARGTTWYVYREVTHITAHFGYIALDLSRLTSDLTRRGRCLAVFDNINRALPNRPGCSLRAQIVPHPTISGGLFWNATWGSTSLPGSDTAHANGVVSYIVESQELGVEWTLTDVNGLVTTFMGAIIPGSVTATYLDGSGSAGWINDGWCKLGRYSFDLQKRLEVYQRARTCQLWGNCALNAKLLGAV